MNRHKTSMLFLFLDCITIVVSVLLAYWLRFDFPISIEYTQMIPYVIISYTLFVFALFNYYSIYKKDWNYAGIEDCLSIVKALSIVYGISFIGWSGLTAFSPTFVVPRSIHIISFMFTVLVFCSSRLIWRLMLNSLQTNQIQPHHQRALIIGAGNAGVTVVRELKQNKANSVYFPVAFIDDDPRKLKTDIYGLRVVGNRHDISEVVETLNIEVIIITIPSLPKIELIELISICKETQCTVKIVPAFNDLIHGKISTSSIRNVSVEDLLGREPVKLDTALISEHVQNRVVLITGAGGSIGSELSRQVANFNPNKLLLLGRGENSIYEIELELKRKHPNLIIIPIIADVQNKERLDGVFNKYKPNVVFHAAAHKHVPLMESNPSEAIRNNVFGTRNVVECSHEHHVSHFVLISTDKAVNPTNVMGTTKRVAELIVQNMNLISDTKFVAVRFGNVLGSRGSVIPVFKKQIELGGPVTVTHPEMVRFFMTIPEAVQLVLQTLTIAKGGETFVLDMGAPVKILDLAKDLIRQSGFEPDKEIKIQFTGIRPGEKMYEELLSTEENTVATKYNRIFVSKVSEGYDDLLEQLQILEKVIKQGNVQNDELKLLLKDIVPTYEISGMKGSIADNKVLPFEKVASK